jgi:hypothetical protein
VKPAAFGRCHSATLNVRLCEVPPRPEATFEFPWTFAGFRRVPARFADILLTWRSTLDGVRGRTQGNGGTGRFSPSTAIPRAGSALPALGPRVARPTDRAAHLEEQNDPRGWPHPTEAVVRDSHSRQASRMMSAEPVGQLGHVDLAGSGRQHKSLGLVDRIGQVPPVEDAEDAGRRPG